MNILSSDEITFHIEFTSDNKPAGSQLYRDAMECSLKKQTTTNYWDTTVKDLYVRTTVDTAAVEDYNNSVELDGKDWFVYEQDDVREDNLCASPATASDF